MRLIRILLLALIWSSLTFANDVNISTVTKNGNTIFFLQAGAFSLEKDAQARQKELAAQVKQPIEIKKLVDKHLYLVQIGPINEYQLARSLKDQLSKNDTKPLNQSASEQPLLAVNQMASNSDQTQTLPNETKLWNLRNADIRAVIAEVSRVTGKNFVIDPRVQGKISIVSSTPMSNKELYPVFLSVLQVSGYAAIPNGEVIKIIPNNPLPITNEDHIRISKWF